MISCETCVWVRHPRQFMMCVAHTIKAPTTWRAFSERGLRTLRGHRLGQVTSVWHASGRTDEIRNLQEFLEFALLPGLLRCLHYPGNSSAIILFAHSEGASYYLV
jgi:hypothetical protein